MIKNTTVLAVSMIMLLAYTPAYADFIGGQTISRIFTGATYTSFGVQNAPPAKTCDYFGIQFRFDHTTPAGKAKLSMLLSAKMAGKKLDVWYWPSTAPGTNHKTGCNGTTLSSSHMIGIR